MEGTKFAIWVIQALLPSLGRDLYNLQNVYRFFTLRKGQAQLKCSQVQCYKIAGMGKVLPFYFPHKTFIEQVNAHERHPSINNFLFYIDIKLIQAAIVNQTNKKESISQSEPKDDIQEAVGWPQTRLS